MNIHRLGGLNHAVLVLLLLGAGGTAAQPQAAMPAMPDPADFLPAPKVEPGDVPRACATSGGRRAESEVAGRGVNMLRSWGMTHFKFPANCTDWDFVISKWQQTVGHPVTGIATDADGERIREELRKKRPQFQEAFGKFEAPRVAAQRAEKEAERKRADDLPKTAVDFLPPGSNLADKQCGAAQGRVSAQVRQEMQVRIAALPPGAVTSGRTAAIERDLTSQASIVAPEWTDLWTRQPVLTEWANKFNCRSVLRFAIEYWQDTIGMPANARDAQAVPRTEQLIAKAQVDLRQFQADQASRFQAEAQASGEAGRARHWSFDELSGKTAMKTAIDRMPTALCTAAQQSITCSRSLTCQQEAAALNAAKGKLQLTTLGRPLNDTFWAPPSAVTKAVRDAEEGVKRCQARNPFTAVANSRLLFAGQEVESAELRFTDSGLVLMKFQLAGGFESARTLLMQRYGRPESQQETRTRYETVQAGGGTAYVPGGGVVTVAPSLAQVEVPYSVTRLIWRSPSTLVEESTGLFTFRFDSR